MQKTIVISGNFRGGTTAVAAVTRALGIHMGYRLKYTIEDADFQKLFYPPGSRLNIPKLRNLVEERNKKRSIWGFKYPGAWEHVVELAPMLRNPHFIFVFRDAYAVGLSENKYTGTLIQSAVHTAAIRTGAMCIEAETLMGKGYPVRYVSYEKLITHKQEEVRHIVKFLKLDIARHDQRFLDAIGSINVLRGYGKII